VWRINWTCGGLIGHVEDAEDVGCGISHTITVEPKGKVHACY